MRNYESRDKINTIKAYKWMSFREGIEWWTREFVDKISWSEYLTDEQRSVAQNVSSFDSSIYGILTPSFQSRFTTNEYNTTNCTSNNMSLFSSTNTSIIHTGSTRCFERLVRQIGTSKADSCAWPVRCLQLVFQLWNTLFYCVESRRECDKLTNSIRTWICARTCSSRLIRKGTANLFVHRQVRTGLTPHFSYLNIIFFLSNG